MRSRIFHLTSVDVRALRAAEQQTRDAAWSARLQAVRLYGLDNPTESYRQDNQCALLELDALVSHLPHQRDRRTRRSAQWRCQRQIDPRPGRRPCGETITVQVNPGRMLTAV